MHGPAGGHARQQAQDRLQQTQATGPVALWQGNTGWSPRCTRRPQSGAQRPPAPHAGARTQLPRAASLSGIAWTLHNLPPVCICSFCQQVRHSIMNPAFHSCWQGKDLSQGSHKAMGDDLVIAAFSLLIRQNPQGIFMHILRKVYVSA